MQGVHEHSRTRLTVAIGHPGHPGHPGLQIYQQPTITCQMETTMGGGGIVKAIDPPLHIRSVENLSSIRVSTTFTYFLNLRIEAALGNAPSLLTI